MELIKVFVGADRSQHIGVRVLEHSIARHTRHPVTVIPMVDLPVRPPKDPAQDQRTGFSFSRFCIPKLAGYQGKAIYMDADMLVFKDIGELWNLPFDGAKVLVQQNLTQEQSHFTAAKRGAPVQRIKQSSVMLLDCSRLDWDIEKIVDGLDQKRYDYAGLLYQLALLSESEVGYGIPFYWNSLEHYDENTGNIHFTDMGTQPWVWSGNKYGHLWVNELRLMLTTGKITWNEVREEVRQGYARPSLITELKNPSWRQKVPSTLLPHLDWAYDRLRIFRPHKVAHEKRLSHLKKLRDTARLD